MKTSSNNLSALIIEDNPGDVLLLYEDLKSTNLPITDIVTVDRLAKAYEYLKERSFSIIFLDLFLPDSRGLESFKSITDINSAIPVVILSGLTDTQIAISAISAGAQDFLIKGEYNYMLLEKVVRYSIERKRNLEIIESNNQMLKASEESYRYLFNNNPAAILIWDINNLQILEVNQSAIELYGYTKEEFLQIIATDIWPEAGQYYSKGDEEKPSLECRNKGTFKHLKKNGKEMSIDIAFHKIIYQDKPVILNLANDVTEKVQLEKKLETERNRRQFEITNAVISAQETERYFLGQELHDNINQILATSKLYLERAMAQKSQSKLHIENGRSLITKAMKEIRDLSHSLLPPSLGQVTLTDTLTDMMKNLRLAEGMNYDLRCENLNEEILSEKLKLTVFRIIQEQVNNILKHAGASQILIGITQYNKKLELKIKDDGIGFNIREKSNGVGLQSIKTRASLTNGYVSIQSYPGKGCELSITFDLSDNYKDNDLLAS